MAEPLACRRAQSDIVALGIAASMLHHELPFSKLSADKFIGTLQGQIKRQHYVFTFQDQKILGYAGWALCSEEVGRACSEGRPPPTHGESSDGDCVVVLTFHDDTPEVAHYQVRYCRNLKPYSPFFGRREYADGRAKPFILPGRPRSMGPMNLDAAAKKKDG